MGLFDRFIRVGDIVINTAMIETIILHDSEIEYDPDGRIYDRSDDMPKDRVSIYVQGPEESQNIMQFIGDDAEALRWLLNMSDSPQNLTDLWRNAQKSHHPNNKDRDHAE